MSKGDEGLSLVGNGNRVITTSTVKSDPKIVGGRGTKRTEPMEPQVEFHLSSDDEGDEHAVEKKRNKTTRFNSLMRMRRWVEMQQSHFAQNATAPPISKEESETSSRIVHTFGKLINSFDEVIDALGDRKRRGDATYDKEGAQRPIKVRKAAVQKVSDDVQPKEKSDPVNSSVESGKNHECPVCKKMFTEKRNLTTHLFVHLSREEQAEVKQGWRHVCYFCSKRFDRPSHLARHVLGHTKEKLGGRCHVCRKAFSSKLGLTRHRFTHLSQDEKVTLVKQGSSRVCLFCHKIFRNNPTYHAHLITHIPEKPFRCDQCGKQFARNFALKRHKRSHSSNPKPFKCDECDQSFTQKHHLKSHKMTVHRKLKDFACRQCSKKFSKKSDMVTHLNGVHLKVRHSCSHCGKTFGWKTNLWTHLKQVHPSECRPPNN